MCIRRESPGYLNLNRKQNKTQTVSAFFFHVKVFQSFLLFLVVLTTNKFHEYQESGINGKKREKKL